MCVKCLVLMRNSLKIVLLLILSLFVADSYAQLSKKHYLPPFYGNISGGRDANGYFTLYLSTTETTPFDVTIKKGDGTEIARITGLSSTSSKYYKLPANVRSFINNPSGYDQPLFITSNNRGKVLNNKGLILESEHDFFVNVRIKTDAQGGSLTSKGLVGAGTHFFAGHMKSIMSKFNPYNSHFFSIMATANNTLVTINKRGFNWFSSNQNNQNSWTLIDRSTNKYQCRLNAGETVTLGYDNAAMGENKGYAFDDPNGTEIESNEPIVVTSGSWASSTYNAGSRDIGFDQIVPVNVVGDQYILVKGRGNKNRTADYDKTKHGEAAIIIATEDNTQITYYDNYNRAHTETIRRKGDCLRLDYELFNKYNEIETEDWVWDRGWKLITTITYELEPIQMLASVYMTSNHPIYVYETLNGSTKKPQTNGMSFIPPLKCTSDFKVTIPRAKSAQGAGEFLLNTVIKGSTSSKNITIDGARLSNSNYQEVAGTDWYSFSYTVGENKDYTVENTNADPINVALYGESNVIGFAGYFSGFGTRPITVPELSVDGAVENCGDNTRIVVQNSQAEWDYTWFKDGAEVIGATNPSFTTTGSGFYSVEAGLLCNGRVSKTYPSDPIYLDPCLNIEATKSSVEGTRMNVTVSLSEAIEYPVTFDLEIVSETGLGVATLGKDYSVVGSLTGLSIPANQLEKTISFDLMDDSMREPEEHFTVRIVSCTMAKISIGTCVATIIENDTELPKMAFEWEQNKWADGIEESGIEGKDITLKVKLLEKTGYPVSVDYRFKNKTAKNGEDFQGTNGTLSFQPEEQEKLIHFQVKDDLLYDIEHSEIFGLELLNVSEAALPDTPELDVAIIDNETKPQMEIASSSVLTATEGNNLTVNYHLTTPLDSVLNVRYKTSTTAGDEYAVEGTDYQAVPLQTVPLNPGNVDGSVSIVTLTDGFSEQREKFYLQFATSTIVDVTRFVDLFIMDANAKPQLLFSDLTVEEGNKATVKLSLTTPIGFSLPISLQFEDVSASNGTDYSATNKTINIGSGSSSYSFDIPTIEDTEEEGDETFKIRISSTSSSVELPNDVLTVTIQDDDNTPIARDDRYTIREGASLNVNVTDNDFLGDLPVQEIKKISSSFTASEITFDQTNGHFTYQPSEEYSGTNTLTYTIKDADGDVTAVATVTVVVEEVDDVPIANDDLYRGEERTNPSYVDISGDVLNNDVGLGDGVLVELVQDVSHGSLTLNNDGTFTYQPDAQYFSSDNILPSIPKDYFTYRLVDQKQPSQTSIGKCQLDVAFYNDAAPVAVNDLLSTNDRTPVDVDPLMNDSDLDGNFMIDKSSFAILSTTGEASVVYENGLLTITPKRGVEETVVIEYRFNDIALDGQASKRSNIGEVRVTISRSNNVPVARCKSPDPFYLSETNDVILSPSDIDNGSSDADRETLTFLIESALWGSEPSVVLSCDHIGEDIPVTLVVSDPKNATSRCATTITVRDNIAPRLQGTVPSDMVFSVPRGVTSRMVSYTEPTYIDNCTKNIVPNRIEGKPSGSSFDLGVHTITYEAQDDSGNKGPQVSFTITIQELNPILSLNDPRVVLCEDGNADLVVQVSGVIGRCNLELYFDGVKNTSVSFTEVSAYRYRANFVGLPNGVHNIKVKATDSQGTVSESNILDLNIKGRPTPLNIQL